MKKLLFSIMAVLLLSCPAPAQEKYYDIQWDLNSDGITAEYLLFVALLDDTLNVPFYDSLFNYPDSQWSQYKLGTFNHDSLFIVDPTTATVEYIPSAGDNPKWIALACFAKSPDGWYSDRSTYVHGEAMPAFLKPDAVNAAGIILIPKSRWK